VRNPKKFGGFTGIYDGRAGELEHTEQINSSKDSDASLTTNEEIKCGVIDDGDDYLDHPWCFVKKKTSNSKCVITKVRTVYNGTYHGACVDVTLQRASCLRMAVLHS